MFIKSHAGKIIITANNAIAQYAAGVQTQWKDINNCDEKSLLWYYPVLWDPRMKNGQPLWNKLCQQ